MLKDVEEQVINLKMENENLKIIIQQSSKGEQ